MSRAFEMAWTRAQLEFRFLRIGPGAAHRFQELASQLIYPNPRLRPPADRLMRNRLGQEGLWAYGISGDLPMLVVTLSDARNLPLVREVLLAHAYWRLRGFRADLIILNQEGASYDAPLRAEILRQIQAHASDAGVDRPGGVFLRDWHTIPEEHRDADPRVRKYGVERQPRIAAATACGGGRGSSSASLCSCRGSRRGAVACRCRFWNCPTSTGWAASHPMAANTLFI